MDKLHIALSELSFAISSIPQLTVWDHIFCPREYLSQQLENRFNKAIIQMVACDMQQNTIAKPSELLSNIETYMSVLLSIENYGNLHSQYFLINRILLYSFNRCHSSIQQCITATNTTARLSWRGYGDESLYEMVLMNLELLIYTYIFFRYLEVLLRKVSSAQILYSPHRHAFIANPSINEQQQQQTLTFNPEEYTDANGIIQCFQL